MILKFLWYLLHNWWHKGACPIFLGFLGLIQFFCMKNHLNNNILLSNLNIFELDSTQSVFFFCPPLWSIQCNTYLILHNIDKNISAQTYIIRCGCFFVTSDPLTSMSESYMSPCILKNVFLLLLILFLWDNEPVGLFYCIFSSCAYE